MKKDRKRQKNERKGQWAEYVSAFFLQLKGWRILARRFKGGRGSTAGEIDLIAVRGKIIAFIEVKARKDRETAAFSITPQQKGRIVKGAQFFLMCHPEWGHFQPRFDAMLVVPWRLPMHLVNAWQDDERMFF